MRARPAMRIIAGRHVGATAEGEVALTVRGPAGCEGTLTLKSERRVASRWLERGRPRVVTLARRRFTLPADGSSEVILKLSPDHLALLRRMGAIPAVARVETARAHAAKGVIVHPPARPRLSDFRPTARRRRRSR